MRDKTILEGTDVSTGRRVRIELRDGFIEYREDLGPDGGGKSSNYLAPGLIDNQVNGFAGIDFSSPDLTASKAAEAAKAILETGVTCFFPTLVTSSHKLLLRNFGILNDACSDPLFGSMVPGFHLEGPYISPLDGYRGCHPLEHVRRPDWREFREYLEASGGRILQVTLAPELEGAIDFIRKCNSEGIVTAIGHSSADADAIKEAADAGARVSTHLGNGCANLIHRHNNPLWPQLADERLVPSLIADGHHLLPEEVKVFCKVKGFDNMMLTSDVVHLAGSSPGFYSFLGSEVELTADGMLIDPVKRCLAGASFPLVTGIGNLLRMTGCTMGEAFRTVTSTPASIYGLTNRGRLEPGMRADIIELTLSDNKITVSEIFLEGKPATRTPQPSPYNP